MRSLYHSVMSLSSQWISLFSASNSIHSSEMTIILICNPPPSIQCKLDNTICQIFILKQIFSITRCWIENILKYVISTYKSFHVIALNTTRVVLRSKLKISGLILQYSQTSIDLASRPAVRIKTVVLLNEKNVEIRNKYLQLQKRDVKCYCSCWCLKTKNLMLKLTILWNRETVVEVGVRRYLINGTWAS